MLNIGHSLKYRSQWKGVANRLAAGSHRRDIGHKVSLPTNSIHPTLQQHDTGQPPTKVVVVMPEESG